MTLVTVAILISSCASIRRFLAALADYITIIIIVKRHDGMGKVCEHICWQPPRLSIFKQSSKLC